MATDIQSTLRQMLISALDDGGGAIDSVKEKSSSNGGLSGIKGLAAGAGAAAVAPLAVRGIGKLAQGLGIEQLENVVRSPGEALEEVKSNLGERVGAQVEGNVKEKVDEAGGPGGLLKSAAKDALPFGGGSDGVPGVGKGRRMPVQQSVDIGIPIETVYNQWTQFEDWPSFMHRVTRVTQDDECTLSFSTKIWGKTKEFKASIETQRPNERIKWRVGEGMDHTGVVTFHELGPNLTRVLVGFNVEPGSLIEKFARGARLIKRAARADLHRFKAFLEMAEQETGAWRGVIEDGEIVEEHDRKYDKQREYADLEQLTSQPDEEQDEQSDRRSRSRGSTRQTSRQQGRQERHGQRQRKSSERGRGGRTRSSGQARTRGGGQARGRNASSGSSTGSRSSASVGRRTSAKGSSGRGSQARATKAKQ